MVNYSDFPYFILKNFLDNIQITNTESPDISGSYLRKNTLMSIGGFGVDLYIKDYEGSYKRIKCYNVESYINNNLFKLTFKEDKSDISHEDFLELNGREIYAKKDSIIYDYINNNEYNDFINTSKLFLYVGKIYLINEYEFHFVYKGFKDFVLNSLPQHIKNSNISSFLNIFFDEVYNKIYYSSKNIKTFNDAYEAPLEYLKYIIDLYNETINLNLNEESLRNYIHNFIHLLKTKGTYTSLQIIWKVLLNNTLNSLTILERWINSGLSGSPENYFLDVPHTFRYKNTNYMLPEKCVDDKWWDELNYSSIYPYNIKSSTNRIWYIQHNLDSTSLLVQCYNLNFERVYPISIVPINSNILQIVFNEPTNGYAFLLIPDEIETHIHSSIWNSTFTPGLEIPALYQFDYINNEKFMPINLLINSSGDITVNLYEARTGYSLYSDIDYLYSTLSALSTWDITHNLGKKAVFVQCYDTSYNEIIPKSIIINDVNNITIEFNSLTEGYAIIKAIDWGTTLTSYVYSTELSQLNITPHYKVMMDLTCEPLADNYIINETILDLLIEKFEMLRPVHKFAHYNLLISPITDFSGKYITLYDYNVTNNKGICDTICCDVVSNPISGCYIYNSYSNKPIWHITHNLNNSKVFVQCYDENMCQIIPSEIEIISDNTLKITFNYSVKGYASIITPDLTFNNSSSLTDSWTLTACPSGSLIQVFDTENNIIIPDAIEFSDSITCVCTFSENTSGYAICVSGDYVLDHFNTASDIWTIYKDTNDINYNLVAVNVYNHNSELVYPYNIENTNDYIKLTFSESLSGYAVFKNVGNLNTIDNVMTDLTYVKFGNRLTNWDPVVNNNIEDNDPIIETIGNISESSDYYYIPIESKKNVEKSITEIGVFDINNDLKFYTKCDEIFKRSDVYISYYLKISKNII